MSYPQARTPVRPDLSTDSDAGFAGLARPGSMQRVGNIISPQWLAAQMGLPVADVQERLAEAERRNNGQEVRPVREAVS